MTITQAVGDGASGRSLLGGRYQVLRALGRGGFGETFLAKDLQMPSARECVIKQLKPVTQDPETYALIRDRFAREAAVLEDLGERSRQIPRLFAYVTEGEEFYLVQEWIDGDTLTQRLNRDGRWQPAAVETLLRQLLPVLATVHSRGIIHRDLKPDNVIVRHTDQQPFLIDFGAVKETMGSQVNTQGQAVSSIVIGTPGFMPPEQAAGRPGYASDIYALGWTAIYLLTGCFPEEFPADPHTGDLIWTDTLQNLPPQLHKALVGATHAYPRSRFATAQEMLATLTGEQPASLSGGIDVAPGQPLAPPPLPPSHLQTVALGRPAPPPTEAIAPAAPVNYIEPGSTPPQFTEHPLGGALPQRSPDQPMQRPIQRPSDDGGKGAGKLGQWSGVLVGFAAVGILVGGGLALTQWIKSLSPYLEVREDRRLIAPDAYFLADAAYESKNRSLMIQRVQSLRDRGFNQAGWLWFPDYANLGDREVYQVFAAAFKTRDDCINLLKDYGRDRGDAYCGRASTNPQAPVDRVMGASLFPSPSPSPTETPTLTSPPNETAQREEDNGDDNGIIDVPEIPFPEVKLPEIDWGQVLQDLVRANLNGQPEPSPSNSPPSAPSSGPTPVAAAADQGLRDYYRALNQGNYQEGWSRLTPEFQRKHSRNSFESYTDWWTQVQRTEVESAQVLEGNGDQALVQAQLVYHLQRGGKTSERRVFRLVRQGDRWLFADVVQ